MVELTMIQAVLRLKNSSEEISSHDAWSKLALFTAKGSCLSQAV
jgi:hypothetical protein